MSCLPTARSVRQEIDAGRDDIYNVLATPAQHHRFDASNMVGRAVTPGHLRTVGDVFTMEMTYRTGGETEHYRTDNIVTALDEGRRVEWAVGPAGEKPLGWRWRYDLESSDRGRTIVTLTYDWTGTSAENMRRFGVPLFDEAELAASLALLAETVLDSCR